MLGVVLDGRILEIGSWYAEDVCRARERLCAGELEIKVGEPFCPLARELVIGGDHAMYLPGPGDGSPVSADDFPGEQEERRARVDGGDKPAIYPYRNAVVPAGGT